MDMEQTWPTHEEMEGGADPTPQRRLAPGTSDYQACWILDDDEDAADEDADEDAEDATQHITAPAGTPFGSLPLPTCHRVRLLVLGGQYCSLLDMVFSDSTHALVMCTELPML